MPAFNSSPDEIELASALLFGALGDTGAPEGEQAMPAFNSSPDEIPVNNIPIGTPIALLFIAAALIFLPSIFRVFGGGRDNDLVQGDDGTDLLFGNEGSDTIGGGNG